MNPYNFTVLRGDTFDGVSFTFAVNGVPLDLTGATAKAQFRARINGPVALELSTTLGLTITDAAAGKIQIDSQKFIIAAGKYLYDLEFTLASGEVKTYLYGELTVQETVTRNG